MNLKRAPQILKVKSIDPTTHTVRFIFSTPVVDRYGEVVAQDGWKLDNYLQNPVVLWGHDASAYPIGKASNMTTNGQLEGDVTFAYDENPEAAMVFELIAGGYLNAGSVGFMNLKWMFDETTDTLTLLENELYEFSIVNIPANPEALVKAMTDMKAKNVDMRVIDRVDLFRKEIEQKKAARFDSLGEEQKDLKERKEGDFCVLENGDGGFLDKDGKCKAKEVEPTAPEKTETPAEKSAEERAKEAIEVLVASPAEIILAAVAALTEKVAPQVADTTKVVPTPVAQGRKYSVSSINRTIRLLAKASGS